MEREKSEVEKTKGIISERNFRGEITEKERERERQEGNFRKKG